MNIGERVSLFFHTVFYREFNCAVRDPKNEMVRRDIVRMLRDPELRERLVKSQQVRERSMEIMYNRRACADYGINYKEPTIEDFWRSHAAAYLELKRDGH